MKKDFNQDLVVYHERNAMQSRTSGGHMIKIGEPTFGSTGQPYHFEMPGGGFARVCTKKDTYANGKEFVGIGVLPDIEVRKNLVDFLENNDPVLEAAVKYLEKR